MQVRTPCDHAVALEAYGKAMHELAMLESAERLMRKATPPYAPEMMAEIRERVATCKVSARKHLAALVPVTSMWRRREPGGEDTFECVTVDMDFGVAIFVGLLSRTELTLDLIDVPSHLRFVGYAGLQIRIVGFVFRRLIGLRNQIDRIGGRLWNRV